MQPPCRSLSAKSANNRSIVSLQRHRGTVRQPGEPPHPCSLWLCLCSCFNPIPSAATARPVLAAQLARPTGSRASSCSDAEPRERRGQEPAARPQRSRMAAGTPTGDSPGAGHAADVHAADAVAPAALGDEHLDVVQLPLGVLEIRPLLQVQLPAARGASQGARAAHGLGLGHHGVGGLRGQEGELGRDAAGAGRAAEEAAELADRQPVHDGGEAGGGRARSEGGSQSDRGRERRRPGDAPSSAGPGHGWRRPCRAARGERRSSGVHLSVRRLRGPAGRAGG